MWKKALFFLGVISSLCGATKAVVFDYGHVLASPKQEVVISFLMRDCQLTVPEIERAAQDADQWLANGNPNAEYWIGRAKEKGVSLPGNWGETLKEVIRDSLGTNSQMFRLIDELKAKNIRVGLLSNIEEKWAKLIRSYGHYQAFDPCLLSYEIGVDKPDPKAYEILLKKVSYSPQEVVFIDNDLKNIEAAKKMGIDAILFESYDQVRAELIKRQLL